MILISTKCKLLCFICFFSFGFIIYINTVYYEVLIWPELLYMRDNAILEDITLSQFDTDEDYKENNLIYKLKLEQPPTLVMYNRVPKCGSTTTRKMLQKLARKNRKFIQYTSTNFDHEDLNLTDQKYVVHNLISLVDSSLMPILFDRHIHIIDFTQFGASNPVYIKAK